MPTIELRPVSKVDFAAFTRAFNHAYSDYFTPISMTISAFRALIAREDLALDASVTAVDDDGAIVGTGMLGIRGDSGWIGGMGVIPGRRRQGIGRQMMNSLIDHARERGINTLYLEVIEANTGAHALYRDIGFVDRRYLHILNRAPQTLPETPATYHVMEDDPDEVLTHYDTFHDTRNCWQRACPSLSGLAYQAQALSALLPTGVEGYAIGWFTTHETRIADLAVNPALDVQRLEVATALIAHIHGQNPHATGSAYNISGDDPLFPAYEAAGYVTDFRQIEMTLDLKNA